MIRTESKKFDKVKYYYDNDLWTKYRVGEAVKKCWISEEEYELIVGEPYNE